MKLDGSVHLGGAGGLKIGEPHLLGGSTSHWVQGLPAGSFSALSVANSCGVISPALRTSELLTQNVLLYTF